MRSFADRRVLIPLAALLLLALSGCDRLGPLGRLGAPFFDRPTLHFDGAEVSDVSLKGLTLSLRVRIHNPNPFRITIREWRYQLSLNGVEIPAGPSGGPREIGARSEQVITIPVEVGFGNFVEVIQRGMNRMALSYDFRSSLEVGSWLGSKAVPFEATGEVSLPAEMGRKQRENPGDEEEHT
ncbi:MAG: LEA type 2 family protein [Deltaproteobacteria bacterium]|nr:LEA type 2 family protein [Deltaproteobacteria bacterium]